MNQSNTNSGKEYAKQTNMDFSSKKSEALHKLLRENKDNQEQLAAIREEIKNRDLE